MEGRVRIGIYYKWDKSWMGGFYYIQNLLVSLNFLNDEEKPMIDFYCREFDIFEKMSKFSSYPYLIYNEVKESFLYRGIKKFIRYINEDLAYRIPTIKFRKDDLFVYPYEMSTNIPCVSWKPDFQEKYLPEYFSKKEVKYRDFSIIYSSKHNVPIVFSSFDSLNDYKKFYPHFNNKIFVLHFGVNIPDFSNVRIEELYKRYEISSPYLLCANQFWKHKNHLFLFRAFKKALDAGLKMQLICTGAFSDYRNTQYIKDIKDYIKTFHLENKIKFLGLIEKTELLCLMSNSYAIVQPSLFEGWNTTVEECKALNKFVFLSNINVHKEQMSQKVCFFDPHNESDLVEKLLHVSPIVKPCDYSTSMKDFGKSFMAIIRYMKQDNLAI